MLLRARVREQVLVELRHNTHLLVRVGKSELGNILLQKTDFSLRGPANLVPVAGKQREHCGLARAVGAEQAEHFSATHAEGDAVQCPFISLGRRELLRNAGHRDITHVRKRLSRFLGRDLFFHALFLRKHIWVAVVASLQLFSRPKKRTAVGGHDFLGLLRTAPSVPCLATTFFFQRLRDQQPQEQNEPHHDSREKPDKRHRVHVLHMLGCARPGLVANAVLNRFLAHDDIGVRPFRDLPGFRHRRHCVEELRELVRQLPAEEQAVGEVRSATAVPLFVKQGLVN
mmetsp:Transcript_15709/g.38914  ORF Transcript_15709/g.38914 Transcript_15709/m.38914 type:complete len:285 (-) Transcript_15709:740-1594(-)